MDETLKTGLEISKKLIEELKKDGLLGAKYPPLWKGVKRGDFHSYLLSFLVLLGDRLGFMSLSDVPTSDEDTAKIVGEKYEKRPDAIWINRKTFQTEVIIECEGTNYIEKTKNLILFSDYCKNSKQKLKLICLICWNLKNKIKIPFRKVKEIFLRGFHKKKFFFKPPGVPILIIGCKTKNSPTNKFVSIIDFWIVDFLYNQTSYANFI